MGYYDEDFYQEPSEFEMQIEEFKQSLLNSVREDYKRRMEELVEENNQLQQVKMDFEAIKRDFKNKEMQLENERRTMLQSVRKERLSELTKDMQVILYKATTKGTKKPKCVKCDNHRRIHYLTPSGKAAYEFCECNEMTYRYEVEEFIRVEFNIRNSKMNAWYQVRPSSSGSDEYARLDGSSQYADCIYKEGMDLENTKPYNVFFKNAEDCQKYCDYLNSKEVK